jgi:hypothetical protein
MVLSKVISSVDDKKERGNINHCNNRSHRLTEMASLSDSTKVYTGSCHCGLIRYTVSLDLTEPKATKCNCTICHKTGFMSIRSTPEGFQLVSPASENELTGYQFGTKSGYRYFCTTCGVQCFAKGSYEFEGQRHDFLSVNVLSLDQDQGAGSAMIQ